MFIDRASERGRKAREREEEGTQPSKDACGDAAYGRKYHQHSNAKVTMGFSDGKNVFFSDVEQIERAQPNVKDDKWRGARKHKRS